MSKTMGNYKKTQPVIEKKGRNRTLYLYLRKNSKQTKSVYSFRNLSMFTYGQVNSKGIGFKKIQDK